MGRTAVLAVALAIVLSACGGGGGSSTADSGGADAGAVPASALASAQAMVAFVGALPPDDMQEPLAIGPLAAPVSDTDEPVPL
jgi:hypothetical protein